MIVRDQSIIRDFVENGRQLSQISAPEVMSRMAID
jgi:hypothetical protein